MKEAKEVLNSIEINYSEGKTTVMVGMNMTINIPPQRDPSSHKKLGGVTFKTVVKEITSKKLGKTKIITFKIHSGDSVWFWEHNTVKMFFHRNNLKGDLICGWSVLNA